MTTTKKRRFPALAVLALCCAAFTACSDDDSGDVVRTNVNPSEDFSTFQSFAFANNTPVGGATIPAATAQDLALVNDSVRDELVARGLIEVDLSASPDLVVVTAVNTDDESAVTYACVPGYWYGYYLTAWDPCPWIEPIYVNYEVGTVAVGLVNPLNQSIAFSGVLQGVLNGEGDVEERVDDGVSEMFEDYPD